MRDAILELEMFPRGMEHWPVSGREAVDLCRQMVGDAEVFIGIYAYRYGWMPDGEDGISITEMEYDWAENIPRFCFIMADEHPYPSDEDHRDKDPVKIAKLDAFKQRVRARHVGFFTTEDNLKAQVIAALAQYRLMQEYTPLKTYLRWLHQHSLERDLLRALDPRRSDPTASGKTITIDQVYTPLDVQRQVSRDEDGHVIPDDLRRDLPHSPEERDDERTPLTAMEAASLNDRLILLGDPGSGKSTFVAFLALCLSGHLIDPSQGWLAQLEAQGWAHGARLPLLITLRALAESLPGDSAAQGNAHHIWAFLKAELTRHGGEAALPAVQSTLDRGGALLLLDGLDEVPAEKRTLVRDAVDDFIKTLHPENRLLVTCRILSYADTRYQISRLVEETVAPFDPPKIEHFIGAWYRALYHLGRIEEAVMHARIADLRSAVRDKHVAPMASNPMLLTVMAHVHNHTGALPRETARLYESCVDLLLLRWKPEEAKALIDELNIREGDLKRILWALAYAAHDDQGGGDGAADIPHGMILGIAGSYLGDDEHQVKARRLCMYVEQRAGLLIYRGTDKHGQRMYAFPHRTFQEYLAGCALAGERFHRSAEEHARKGAHWRVALLLATGHLLFNDDKIDIPLDAVDTMCRRASDPQSDDDWRVIALAGEMLLLIGADNAERDATGREALENARTLLARLIGEGKLPPIERAAAGRTLGLLGDPRPGVGLRPDGLPDIEWANEIAPGTYNIGESGQDDNPPREIEIKQPYRVSKYLITQQQYLAFQNDTSERGYMYYEWWEGLAADEDDKRPAEPYFKFDNHPMERVNWYQAVAFCRWLNEKLRGTVVGTAFMPSDGAPTAETDANNGVATKFVIGENAVIRLPHEYEWEVAARGTDGRTYSYPGDFDSTRANTGETSIGQTSAVGIFPDGVSPCAALDMTGNVWEWCINTYGEPDKDDLGGTERRALRGGSWGYLQGYARAAARLNFHPDFRPNGGGFRVVCVVPHLQNR